MVTNVVLASLYLSSLRQPLQGVDKARCSRRQETVCSSIVIRRLLGFIHSQLQILLCTVDRHSAEVFLCWHHPRKQRVGAPHKQQHPGGWSDP